MRARGRGDGQGFFFVCFSYEGQECFVVERVLYKRCYNPMLATCDFLGPHTLLHRWRKELEWELKYRSHESKLLWAQVNRSLFQKIGRFETSPRIGQIWRIGRLVFLQTSYSLKFVPTRRYISKCPIFCNRPQESNKRIHFCLTKSKVALIHDSCFWTQTQTLSVIDIRGCKKLRNYTLCARGYSTVWSCLDVAFVQSTRSHVYVSCLS